MPDIELERDDYEKMLKGGFAPVPIMGLRISLDKELIAAITAERSMAYERCCEILRSESMRMERANGRIWFFVEYSHPPTYEYGAALSYLSRRCLIEREAEGSDFFDICDEDEPMKAGI